MSEVKITVEQVIEKLKAELGNLVYQLAVKEAIIEELKRASNPDPAAGKQDE